MREKIEDLLKQPWVVPAAIGILGFGGGLGIGYILGKRKAEPEVEVHKLPEQLNFDSIVETEIVQEHEPPPKTIIRPPKVVISEEVAVSKDILKVNDLSDLRSSMLEDNDEEDDSDEDEESDDEEPDVLITIAPTADWIEWDWEAENQARASGGPYILHKEEFWADEMNYTQTTLTYYAEDDIMADEDEKPVYNYAAVTGPLVFGHGSGDPNTVYVRNDERRAEYEIIKLDALYSVEVLGLEIENNERVADLKHSKVPKFRME